MARRRKKKPLLRKLATIVLVAMLAAWLLSVALTLPLRWADPTTTAFMLQDDSGRIPVIYEWRSWDAIGDRAALAVVAAEDQRFAEHWGIDVKSINRALGSASSGGRLRGASTITQQLAKNLYLWPGRSFVRKGLEAWAMAHSYRPLTGSPTPGPATCHPRGTALGDRCAIHRPAGSSRRHVLSRKARAADYGAFGT